MASLMVAPEVLSIPAWFDWRIVDEADPRGEDDAFNPSLVRLARRPLWRGGAGCGTFNPSLVRLAPVGVAPQEERRYGFQSQLGSIGAWLLSRRWAGSCRFQSQLGSIGASPAPLRDVYFLAFNPSLVRLAQDLPGPHASPGRAFNPSLVRLAQYGLHFTLPQIRAFNPSLVRLAPAYVRPRAFNMRNFQSQLGSIGAPPQ